MPTLQPFWEAEGLVVMGFWDLTGGARAGAGWGGRRGRLALPGMLMLGRWVSEHLGCLFCSSRAVYRPRREAGEGGLKWSQGDSGQ